MNPLRTLGPLLVALAGCSTVPPVESVQLPNGHAGHRVRCRDNEAQCRALAIKACAGAQFDVYEQREHHERIDGGVTWQDAGRATEVASWTWLIECRPPVDEG